MVYFQFLCITITHIAENYIYVFRERSPLHDEMGTCCPYVSSDSIGNYMFIIAYLLSGIVSGITKHKMMIVIFYYVK
jgi:membrane associated rhomboid family serine protease